MSVRGADREGAPALAHVVERRLLRAGRVPGGRARAAPHRARRRRRAGDRRAGRRAGHRRAAGPRRACRCSPPTRPQHGRLRRRSAAARRRAVSLADLEGRRGLPRPATRRTRSARAPATACACSPARARRRPRAWRPIVDYDGAGHATAPPCCCRSTRAQALLGRRGRDPPRARVQPRATRPSGAALTDRRASPRRRRRSPPLGLELQDVKRDGLELADESGRRLRLDLHDVRQLLDRRRHPADLPDLRDALRGAAHRARHRPRDRHPPRAPRADVRLRGARLRPRRRRARRRARRRPSRSRWSRCWPDAFSATGLEIQHAVTLRSLVVAYALGVLLTFVVVARVGVARERLNIVAAVRGLPEPPRRAGGRRRVGLGVAGLRARRGAGRGPGSRPTRRRRSRSGVSLAVISLVPLAAPPASRERIAYTVAGAAAASSGGCSRSTTMNAIAGRELEHGLLGVDRQRPDGRRRRHLADRLQRRRRCSGSAMRVLGRIRALAPVLKMAMAYPAARRASARASRSRCSRSSCSRSSSVRRPRGAFLARRRRRPEASAAASTSAPRSAPRARSAIPATADPRDARDVGRRLRRRRRRVRRAGQGPRRPAAAALETYPVRGFDGPFLLHTTYGARRAARRATTRRARSGHAMAPPPRPGRRRPARRPAPRQLGLRAAARLPPARLLPRGQGRSTRCRVEVRDPLSGTTRTLTVIGVLSDTVAASTCRASGPRSGPRTALFGARAAPTIHHIALAPGRGPGRAAAARSSARSSPTAWRRSRPRSGLHEAIGAVLHAQLAAARLHGRSGWSSASPRSASSAPARSSSAASRSACCARSASARDGPAQLPARVVVHRADRDRGRHARSA